MTKGNEERPAIQAIGTGAELRRWYWLKLELAAEARRVGVKCTGAKFTILERFWEDQQATPEKTKIQPHNQFNQYARDFMAANPGLGMKDARKFWARKRMLPSDSGRHRYEPSDLKLLD